MKLSIITINYNNASGLKKTMESVLSQTSCEFEYVVIDGNSTDGSIELIRSFDSFHLHSKKDRGERQFTWISESDNGIYHAMNKGIKIAKGEYLQFLNSGDIFTSLDVTERMLSSLTSTSRESFGAKILYGNMLKELPTRILRDRGFEGRMPTLLDFYTGTLNHSPAYIRRSLFDTYGLYDETLRIVSDWKWYLQVLIMNNVQVDYIDIDVSIFDMNGISNANLELEKQERRQVLSDILPISILTDYESWAYQIDQIKRVNRYLLSRKGFWLMERVIFKLEKWFGNKEQSF
jgi:glycosyltransferase involved in cell wall biosynthesis